MVVLQKSIFYKHRVFISTVEDRMPFQRNNQDAGIESQSDKQNPDTKSQDTREKEDLALKQKADLQKAINNNPCGKCRLQGHLVCGCGGGGGSEDDEEETSDDSKKASLELSPRNLKEATETDDEVFDAFNSEELESEAEKELLAEEAFQQSLTHQLSPKPRPTSPSETDEEKEKKDKEYEKEQQEQKDPVQNQNTSTYQTPTPFNTQFRPKGW